MPATRPTVVLIVVVIVSAATLVLQAQEAPQSYRIEWATYVGGSAWDQLREVIPYPDGSVLVGGLIKSAGLPTSQGAVQAEYAGDDPALGHGGIYGGDAYLVHLSADGATRLAATYFGGSKQERGVYGMALDSGGNIVIGGATRSPDMPTTEGAYQQAYGGGKSDMYAARLSADMTELHWCSYVGAAKEDWPRGGIALDAEDNVCVLGSSDSPGFPTTEGVLRAQFQGQKRDAAVAKLSADGSRLLMGTLVGGGDWEGLMGARVGPSGDIYIAGHTQSADLPVTQGAPQSSHRGKADCWLARIAADGSRLVYCTYLGGSENEWAEHRPWLCEDGSFLLTGVTASADFPTTPGACQRQLRGKTDGFLVKLAPEGDRLVFATLLGGSGGDFFLMPTPGPDGNIFMVGQSSSADFPVTPDALQPTYGGGKSDGVLAILSPDASEVLYATYLGGGSDDMIRSVALGSDGAVYLVGSTSSDDFPVTSGAMQPTRGGASDGYVVKLVPAQ